MVCGVRSNDRFLGREDSIFCANQRRMLSKFLSDVVLATPFFTISILLPCPFTQTVKSFKNQRLFAVCVQENKSIFRLKLSFRTFCSPHIFLKVWLNKREAIV
jgi:hypothetical protein